MSEFKRKYTTNIKQLREAAGFTQHQLAKKMRVHQPRIAHWESGYCKPMASSLKKLTKLLGPLEFVPL